MRVIKYLSSILSVAVILVSCANQYTRPSEEVQKEAEYYYKMGVASLNEGNLKLAYVQLHKSYELDPNNVDILHSLGIVFMKLGDDEKAMQYFKRVVALDGRYSDAYNHIGLLHFKYGRYKEAIDAFNQALSNPLYKFPERGYYHLGYTYYRIGQYDNALKSFQTSIRLVPTFSPSYFGLALTFNKKGNYGAASSLLMQAIALDERYKGDVERFKQDIKSRITSLSVDEDTLDYLEILKY